MCWPLLCLLARDVVGNRAGVYGQSVVVTHAAQLSSLLVGQIQREKLEHLAVTILVNDVNAIVLLDELVHFASEWIGADSQVIDLDVLLALELVHGFDHGPVTGSVGDDADFRPAAYLFGLGNERASVLELSEQAVHVVDVVVGPFAVLRL